MQETISKLLPSIQGGTGFTLLQAVPDTTNVDLALKIIIGLGTVAVQLITLFKKKK